MFEQFDWIAFVHHAFDEDCTINACHPVVSLRDFLQNRWRLFSGIRIERDNHAACVALQNRNDYLRADLYRSTNKVVFSEAVGGC